MSQFFAGMEELASHHVRLLPMASGSVWWRGHIDTYPSYWSVFDVITSSVAGRADRSGSVFRRLQIDAHRCR